MTSTGTRKVLLSTSTSEVCVLNIEEYCKMGTQLPKYQVLWPTVLASNLCTRHLDGYKVKMMGRNCLNYTIKEKMHGQLCKNWEKNTGSCLILAETMLWPLACSRQGTLNHPELKELLSYKYTITGSLAVP